MKTSLKLKIIIVILITIEVLLTLKSTVILKSILSTPGIENVVSLLDKIMMTSNLVFSFVIFIFLIVVIQNLYSKLLNTSQDMSVNSGSNLTQKQSKKQKTTTNIEKNKVLEELSLGIDNTLNINKFTEKVLSNIAETYKIMQGLFFIKYPNTETYKTVSTYAFYSEEAVHEFADNEGLSGQVAASQKLLNINNIPENYITVISGLGNSSPSNLLILPVVYQNQSIGVIELASFKEFDKVSEEILMEFVSKIAEVLHIAYLSKINS